MARAGQEEERPGDEPEGIHYFDFSDPFGTAEGEEDPFAAEAPALHGDAEPTLEPLRVRPKPLCSERADDARPSHDVFEFALTGLSPASDPGAGAMASGSEAASRGRAAFTTLTSFFEAEPSPTAPREQFAAVFDAACAEAELPFLAVALRMPAEAPAGAHFPLVEQGIASALRGDDALLADFARRRLVAVLRGRGADAARPLFAHLMDHLREHATNAEDVGRHIAVLAAPGGRPFHRAADFLAAAYDGP